MASGISGYLWFGACRWGLLRSQRVWELVWVALDLEKFENDQVVIILHYLQSLLRSSEKVTPYNLLYIKQLIYEKIKSSYLSILHEQQMNSVI